MGKLLLSMFIFNSYYAATLNYQRVASILCWLQINHDMILSTKFGQYKPRRENIISKEFNLIYSGKCHQPTNSFCLLLSCQWLTLTSALYVLLLLCLFQQGCPVKFELGEVPTTFTTPSFATKGPGNLS